MGGIECEDDTRDQMEQNSGQENQSPDKPEESISDQENVGDNPPETMNGSPTDKDNPAVNSKDTPSLTNTLPSNGNPTPTKGGNTLLCAAIGVVAGTAAVAVAVAPVALGAAGFTAGGVAAGSLAAAVQSAFYGGSVASGSLFAIAQSAGAAGIGAAGNAVIGGITGMAAAIGAKIFDSRSDTIKLLICGSGNGAHAFAGIASSLKGKEPTSITSKPALVTKNPQDAMRDVDIVVFMLPAFAHQVFLDTLKPYIKSDTIIVGLPGTPGFEFQVRDVLGDIGRQCTIMNFESSPWVYRTTEFGVKCEVLKTKETLFGAMKKGEGPAPKKEPVSTLQNLLGPLPKLIIAGHLLGVQLMSTNAYLHTSILYGQWEGVSDEILNIAKGLEVKTGADMSKVVHIHQWQVRRYPHDISNKATFTPQYRLMLPTKGSHIRHPGIAEIVGIKTPNIDKVLTWCQKKMGKEYLVNSKLQGKDVASSRAPQRYGFTTLESIL
ncbi:hypothetical protein OS493_024054 [Desmophyllum pertusum]|uniref:Tauropine dehydrogenase n=1 Tax=Desmophyllum pertusum TaxID=174260 RepID=A0A9W9ZMI8_9CNID|nr:hypothetical protein OS493_024054 [Desmophyllum pertusum]